MTDINDWPDHPDADPDCECCLGDGLQADGETPCPCIDARKANIAAQTITPAPHPAGEAVPVDLSHGWLIHKAGRGWYRPNAKGYTGCLAEAGRYSLADALLYSHPNGFDGPRDNITIKHESEAATTRSDLCASGHVRASIKRWKVSFDGVFTEASDGEFVRYADLAPQPSETVAEADQFDRADWFWRDLAPDDSGDCPGNALQFHPELTVSLIHGSYRGPSRWVFRAEVLDPDSNDTEVLHFDTRDEAMAAAQERAAALRALKGDA